MINLSVNVNKIATLRNSRGGNVPNLESVTQSIIDFGADGITVHPRPDAEIPDLCGSPAARSA